MHVRGTTNIAALCDFGDNSKFEQWPPSCRKPCALVLLSSLPSGASKPPRPEQHLRLHYSNAVAISKLPSLGFATAKTNLKHTAYVLVKGGAAELSLGHACTSMSFLLLPPSSPPARRMGSGRLQQQISKTFTHHNHSGRKVWSFRRIRTIFSPWRPSDEPMSKLSVPT